MRRNEHPTTTRTTQNESKRILRESQILADNRRARPYRPVYTPGKFAPTKMSFSFGFDAVPTPAPSELVSEATPSAPQAAEHQPSEARLEAEQWPVEEVVVETGAVRHTLRKPVQPEALLPELIGDGEKVADLDSSDLVKGVYEGGFKLWECARDMMEVLEELRLQGALEVRRSQSQAPAAALGSGC